MIDLVSGVASSLSRSGQRLAVAESCTGGLLGGRITSVAGASSFFLGGVVAYANEVKVSLLGVDPELLRVEGAVSARCAEAMAAGVASRLGADWALSVTGVAGPGGGSASRPVGLVFLGLWSPGGVASRELRLGGDRAEVRDQAVEAALAWLLERLG